MSLRRVAVTGAAGVVGRVLCEGLHARYELRGIDIRAPRGSRLVRGDMRRLRDVERALAGCDAVVDLAGRPGPTSTWEQVRAANLPPVVNVLEAARRVGVHRVVYASSNHVTGRYELEEPYASIVAGRYSAVGDRAVPLIGPDAEPRPDSPYAVGKLYGELAGRYASEVHGLSVICLRLGSVLAGDRPLEQRHYATLLSHRDLVALVDACLRAPDDLRYEIVYGVSANRWRFWDVARASIAIGWEPRDDAESWR